LAASWWKLFHRQIIFEGSQGGTTRTSASATVSLVGRAPANMSPSCRVIVPS
jgi:hypothetical protein